MKDRRQLLRTGSSPDRSMKQRAIRERRNHKPQDARRFNCRLNCGPTRTYATTLEATRPSLSRALPISSLALAALLGQHRSTHVATVGPVCLPRSSCILTLRCPKQNHIPSPRHTSSHMAVQKSTSTAGDCLCCQQRSSSCHSLLFCFGSLVTRACTLAKTESVSPHVAGVASPQRLPTTLTQAPSPKSSIISSSHRNAARAPSLLSKLEAPCPILTASIARSLRVQRNDPANSASTHLRLADSTLVPRPPFALHSCSSHMSKGDC